MPVVELDYCPHAYQAEVHLSEARYSVIVGGRRVGKSKMALQELVKHCLTNPGAVAWWVSPTIAMAREVGWEEFLCYREALEPGIVKVNDAVMRVRWKNGSVMYFKGGDNEKSLRGRGLTMVVVDEAAFLDEEIWTRALLPALADKKGRAVLISTPNGRNWFFNMFLYAQTAAGWECRHWPSYMNPLMDETEMTNLAANISEIDFRQEFMGEFITRGGMVYDEFTDENIIGPGIPSNHDYEICLGVDFGYANPTAICFMAINRDEGTVVQFDEFYGARVKIDDVQAIVAHKLASHGLSPASVKTVYTDPSGNADELSSGISPVDSLRMGPFRFNVVNKKSEIAPGLALVRSYIRAGNGQRRFFITANCVETIRSLRGYTYNKLDGNDSIKEEPLKDGLHDHMADAIRYFFVCRFDQIKWVASTVEQYDYSRSVTTHKMVHKRCQRCRRQFSSRTPKNAPPSICRECNQE